MPAMCGRGTPNTIMVANEANPDMYRMTDGVLPQRSLGVCIPESDLTTE